MDWCRFEYSGIISFDLVRDERVFKVKDSPFRDYKIGEEHFALDSITFGTYLLQHRPFIPLV